MQYGHGWPDNFDAMMLVAYLMVALFVPLLGYFFLVADYRAYLRSLKGYLVLATKYLHELPEWARETTPRCIAVFGLTIACTEEELLQAYRDKVKVLHPDRGGDRQQFLRLQGHFEQALECVRTRVATTAS